MSGIRNSPEFATLAAKNPKAAKIALKVDEIAEETVRPLLTRFRLQDWPADLRTIVIDAVIQKLFADLKGAPK